MHTDRLGPAHGVKRTLKIVEDRWLEALNSPTSPTCPTALNQARKNGPCRLARQVSKFNG
ncbi:MAG TPA: hypothetical protein ENH12_00775 [Proteobacteria bacterium]|nr:hypothetical protein [Pseudomonadota bacterium]